MLLLAFWGTGVSPLLMMYESFLSALHSCTYNCKLYLGCNGQCTPGQAAQQSSLGLFSMQLGMKDRELDWHILKTPPKITVEGFKVEK